MKNKQTVKDLILTTTLSFIAVFVFGLQYGVYYLISVATLSLCLICYTLLIYGRAKELTWKNVKPTVFYGCLMSISTALSCVAGYIYYK